MGQPVVYFEIVGRDGQRLRSFYSELFGWEIAPTAINPDYGSVERITNAQGIGIAGAVAGVPEPPSSTWRGPQNGYPGPSPSMSRYRTSRLRYPGPRAAAVNGCWGRTRSRALRSRCSPILRATLSAWSARSLEPRLEPAGRST